MTDKPKNSKNTKDKIKDEIENENLEKRAQETLEWIGMGGNMFNPQKINTYFELYNNISRENFSYSKKTGHMNEYKKAICNHKQKLNKPFNKMDGVGV